MADILIVDDDSAICFALSHLIQSQGHDVHSVHSCTQAIDACRHGHYDLVFLDVGLPDGNGLEIIPQLRASASNPEIIIITGTGTADGAEMAIRSGAWDYLPKGASLSELLLPLTRALQSRQEQRGPKYEQTFRRDGIVGSGPRLRSCLEVLFLAAKTESNVLIQGETGTGKESFALAIHNNSSRAAKSFVILDCAALPETLVESLLFGHIKGSYTGALRDQEGLIHQAHEGTLFLDEVGELPLSIQKTFLRVLQEHRFRPVGAETEIQSNFRLVAATNRELDRMVETGQFRADLLYRLRSCTIRLPGLRECREDIPAIARYHLARICKNRQEGVKELSPEYLIAFSAYQWPGNVREMIHALEFSIAAVGDGKILLPQHLPTQVRVAAARSLFGEPPEPNDTVPSPGITTTASSPGIVEVHLTFKQHREKSDYEYLSVLSQKTGGRVSEMCRISGLSKSRLYELLKIHQIS
jgi:two-component system, NtrC family, response regulator